MTFQEAIAIYKGRLGDETNLEIADSIWESMNARELFELIESFRDYAVTADGLSNPWATEAIESILSVAWREAEAELDEAS